MTDGGQELEADQEVSGAVDEHDADPFRWGTEVDREGEPTDATGTDGESSDDTGSRGDESRDADSTDAGSTDAESTDAESLPATAGIGDPADVATRIRTMEQRLDRLSDIASDVALASLNGDLKLSRGDDRELETVHERIQMQAEHVEREVERLTDHLAALEREFAAQSRPSPGEPTRGRSPYDGHDGRADPVLDGPGPRIQATEPGGQQTAGDEEPTAADAEADVELVEPEPDRDDASAVGPAFDQLIPGTELRDMWRISRRTARNGDGGLTERSMERWIIETRPSASAAADDGVPEFPPEVTEFTLDDDEISFEMLLRSVHADEPS